MKMSLVMAAMFPEKRNGRGPCREQNLLIGQSKHIYCLKDGALKYQQKPLDPRIPGKTLVTHFVLLDVDTGVVYGECHEVGSDKDLAGFLARAWSVKPHCLMRGIPSILNVPKIVRKDELYKQDIELVSTLAKNIQVGELPSGFSAGAHAVRLYEKAVTSIISSRNPVGIYVAQACSDALSAQASSQDSFLWKEAWQAVQPPEASFFNTIDRLYDEPGAWRAAPFDRVLS